MRVLLSLLIFLSVCPDELLYERIHKFRLSLLLLCSFNLLSTEIFFVYRESSAAMSYNVWLNADFAFWQNLSLGNVSGSISFSGRFLSYQKHIRVLV